MIFFLDLSSVLLLLLIFTGGSLQAASGPFSQVATFLLTNNWIIFLFAAASVAYSNYRYSEDECIVGPAQKLFIALETIIDLVGLSVPLMYIMTTIYPFCAGGGSLFALLYAAPIFLMGAVLAAPHLLLKYLAMKVLVPGIYEGSNGQIKPVAWLAYAIICLVLLVAYNALALLMILNKDNFDDYLALFAGSPLDAYFWGLREAIVHFVFAVGGPDAVTNYEHTDLGIYR